MLSPAYPLSPIRPVSRQADDVVCSVGSRERNWAFWAFSALRRYNYWTDALKRGLARCQMRVEESVVFLTWVIWALWLGWASKSESVSLGLPTPLPLHRLCATHTRYARRKAPKRKALLKILE